MGHHTIVDLHVSHCITSSTKHESWDIEALDKLDTICVSRTAQIEAAEFVTIQAVCSTLQDYGLRAIVLHNFADHCLANVFVGFVVNAVLQWKIDGMILAFVDADITNFASAREELSTADTENQ
jgi:hypothetical protein